MRNGLYLTKESRHTVRLEGVGIVGIMSGKLDLKCYMCAKLVVTRAMAKHPYLFPFKGFVLALTLVLPTSVRIYTISMHALDSYCISCFGAL